MEETLSSLRIGQSARVAALDAEGALRARLEDLGFTPGARVTCLLAAPAGGPRAYRVRGAVIALRGQDAEGVRICKA